MNILEMAKKAKTASLKLQSLPEAKRIKALSAISKELIKEKKKILTANLKDQKEAKKNNLDAAMLDRLSLTEKNITDLSQMCLEVAKQKQVVGTIAETSTRSDGLVIQKQRIPIGVIGMIFESRPNVVIDGAALAIKSGNAIILKGGKEAINSNKVLHQVITKATKTILPAGSIHLIETREEVGELLKLNQYIDLMVPRGGSSLVQYVKTNATMPVIAHDKGLCHTYVHHDADVDVAKIVLNAKVQRSSACNALETLLLHEKYKKNKEVVLALIDAGVEIHGDKKIQKFSPKILAATPIDFATEWLAKKISIRMVKSEDEAIEHIQQYSSHHTEAILAKDKKVIDLFLNSLDAACLVVNGSTRFNDGGELGLGAELGISTSKLHAYGPMGAAEMTTTRFIVTGSGHIRN
ncbi:MAG: glutamate-5-semialdehyde dehydrogenase [Bacteriovoracaceae bacterium]|nr:glutamate-5-semialdehyde dehydrogenase [Bacteriovoracaceae bacterium]